METEALLETKVAELMRNKDLAMERNISEPEEPFMGFIWRSGTHTPARWGTHGAYLSKAYGHLRLAGQHMWGTGIIRKAQRDFGVVRVSGSLAFRITFLSFDGYYLPSREQISTMKRIVAKSGLDGDNIKVHFHHEDYDRQLHNWITR